MSGSQKTVKGLHRVQGGKYVYAWRGGPRIHAKEGTPEFIRELSAALETRKQVPANSILALVNEYRQSRQFLELAPLTRADHERNFCVILDRFAAAPVDAFSRPEVRKIIRKWHESIPGPRAADKALGTLSRVIEFGMVDGLILLNATAKIPKRYKREPNPTPWSQEELARFISESPAHLAIVAELGAETGLARADLARVSWSHVKATHIEIDRQKTKQITRITLNDSLRDLLALIPRTATTILTNRRGRPWSVQGLAASFDKHRRSMGIVRTLHDLRAVRGCRLYSLGFTDEEVADELGWAVGTCRHIRLHYVDQEALFARRVVRLSEHKDRK